MKGRNLIFWGWRFGILVHNLLARCLVDRYLYEFYAIDACMEGLVPSMS